MMIFPSLDRELLTHELGTYGITYSDTNDCLCVAPKLKGHSARVGDVTGVVSPCEVVCLLAYDTEFVGALFSSVSQFISYFWNGNMPEVVPADFLSDMVDLYLADLQVKYGMKGNEGWLQAEGIHALARQVVQGFGSVPECILERIREHIEVTYTVQ